MAVVAAQLLKHVGVRVHRRVIVAAHRASRVQQQAAMHLDERLPRRLPGPGIGSLEETGQLRWEQGDPPLSCAEALTYARQTSPANAV
jgi:hypothetical protein